MANNPLQQYFRQPKIFISLPSKGVYNKPGAITGDVTHLPVFGMTGMDEILLKTPDALLVGDSTVKVLSSCCPGIADPWDICALDMDLILAAIRIATFGEELTVAHNCTACGTPNEYILHLTKLIDHYSQCEYDNKLVLDELVVTIKPMTYRQTTNFALRNFQIQQKLAQVDKMEDEVERKDAAQAVFEELASLRNEVFATGIESVEAGGTVVTERAYIAEWIANSDRAVIKRIAEQIEKNQTTWTPPEHVVECENCQHQNTLKIDLDQANFFVSA